MWLSCMHMFFFQHLLYTYTSEGFINFELIEIRKREMISHQKNIPFRREKQTIETTKLELLAVDFQDLEINTPGRSMNSSIGIEYCFQKRKKLGLPSGLKIFCDDFVGVSEDVCLSPDLSCARSAACCAPAKMPCLALEFGRQPGRDSIERHEMYIPCWIPAKPMG